MQVAETSINAFRADAEAKLAAVAVAQGEADQAVAAYVAKGGLESDLFPKAEAPKKSLSKMNRVELNARADEAGVESPDKLETNADVVKAIQKAEA